MTSDLDERQLHQQVTRWVAEGIIDPDQARRIEAAESAGPEPGDGRMVEGGGRRGLVVEALGYLGGGVSIVAGVVAVAELWPGIPPGAQEALAVAVGVVLLAGGAFLTADRNPASGRLRGVLWLLSVAAVGAALGIATTQTWHLADLRAAVLTGAGAAAYALVLWVRWPHPLQHLALAAALAVVVGAGAADLAPDARSWLPGLAVWIGALAWGAAVHGGLLPPRAVGYVVSAVGLLVASQATMSTTAGTVLAAATVAGLLVAGVVLRNVWLLGIGGVGVVQVVPQIAVTYLPTSLAAPFSLLVVGVALLGLAVRIARTSDRGRTGRRPS